MSEKREEKQRARDHAKMLYISSENLSQKEVAQRVGVTEQTISRWAREASWEELRRHSRFTKDNELKRMYSQLAELNAEIEKRDPGQRYPTSKEVDIQRKLAINIKQLESRAGITEIVQVTEELIAYYRRIDLVKAQEIAQLFDEFIQYKIKQSQ